MLAHRLLAATGGSGGFLDVGYSMSADEITFWQQRAALLDPAAYVYTLGSGATVTATEPWFLVNGWNIAAAGSGVRWFHRSLDVDLAMPLAAGVTLTNAALATAFTYVCKPELVTGGDARYTDDPRALYFDRITQLSTLTQYHLGVTATGGSSVNATFPTDFTNGFVVQVSTMDLAWLILLESGGTSGMNTLGEVSDADPIRFAERVFAPFVRTTFTKILGQGVSLATGAGNLVYVKLPGGW